MAAQIVSCQIHQHHMFGIFLGIIEQKIYGFHVLSVISRPFGGAGNRIDADVPAPDLAMRFGRRAKDAVSAEIEIKQIG